MFLNKDQVVGYLKGFLTKQESFIPLEWIPFE